MAYISTKTKGHKIRKLTNLILVFLIVLLFSQAAFADEQAEEGWEFMLTPYLWAAGMNASIGAGEVSVPVDLSFGDVLDKLKFGGMIHFGMKKGRWGVFLDYLYMNVGEDDITVELPGPLALPIAADFRYKMNLFELAGTFRLAGTRTSGLDAIVGLRYLSNNAELDIRGGGPLEQEYAGSYKQSWTDLMLGFRYNVVFSRKWVMGVRGDIGMISSNITFNIMAIIGYRLSRTIDLLLAYRYFDINYTNDKEGRDYFEFDGYLNGLALGINFRFGKRL